jgi:lysine decarboxylase
VPGHKGGFGADEKLRAELADALKFDIPQDMFGIDVGPSPTPAERSELLAAESHGAEQTWFLTNGATQGNHALTLALAPLGAKVIVQRNSHGSVVDGLVLSGGLPEFVSPLIDEDLGIAHGVLPEVLEQQLNETPDARAVFVVSPTYYGTCADIAALATIASSHGVPLVVDQSWGAHFGLHPLLPTSALQLGADAVLTSTHKTSGSFTQSAMLHVARNSLVSTDAVDRAVRLVRSTSPSSLLLSSLDAARRNLAINGRELVAGTLDALDGVRARIKAIEGLDVVGDELDGEPGVHDTDPLRLVVDTRGTGQSGFAMAESLRETSDVIVELATDAVVVFVIGVSEDPVQLDRLVEGVEAAAKAITLSGDHPALPIDVPAAFKAELAVSPREAFLGATEVVEFETASGRICGESIAVYPPGIPALLPGERITDAIIAHLRKQVTKGARLHGASDPDLKTIHVLPDEAVARRHR